MHLTTSEDIDAPIENVFAVITDFDLVERAAMRREIDVQRTNDVSPPGVGLAWEATFGFKGKTKTAKVVLTEMTAPETVRYETDTGGLEASISIDLVALSRTSTRISLSTNLDPKTLSARLLIQSLKLAKSSIESRFQKRAGELASAIEKQARSLA